MFSRQQPRSPERHSNVKATGLSRVETITSLDSDATIDKQPGAGRTVGIFFAWLGSRLERSIDKRAERLGLGYMAVVNEIRRRIRHDDTALEDHLKLALPGRTLSRSETKVLRKLCKKLIRHARSQVLVNQLVVLDEMISLAVEYSLVRAILASCDLNRLITRYTEPNLLVATQRALGAVEFSNVHRVWAPILSLCSATSRANFVANDVIKVLDEEILETLRDPLTSFLSARYYKHAIKRFKNREPDELDSLGTLLEDFAYLYTGIASRRPDSIEWSNFNSCIHPYHYGEGDNFSRAMIDDRQVLTLARDLDAVDFMRHTLPFLLEYYPAPRIKSPENDPSNNSYDEVTSIQEWEWPQGIAEMDALYNLVTFLTKSSDYRVHLSCMDHLEDELRRSLAGTMFADKVVFTYCILFSHIQRETAVHDIEDDELRNMCAPLVSFVEANRGKERSLALLLTKRLIAFNRYCKSAVLRAAQEISTIVYASLVSRILASSICCYPRKQISFSALPSELFRVTLSSSGPGTCDLTTGCLEHHLRELILRECQNQGCVTIDVMDENTNFDSHAIIYVEVNGDETPFNSMGHFPILAFPSGKLKSESQYIAQVSIPEDERPIYTLVADGALSVTYTKEISRKGRLETVRKNTSKFAVLLLRHDPMDFDPCHCMGELEDPTGPVGWRNIYRGGDIKCLEIVEEYNEGRIF